jgi:hypothetical protein
MGEQVLGPGETNLAINLPGIIAFHEYFIRLLIIITILERNVFFVFFFLELTREQGPILVIAKNSQEDFFDEALRNGALGDGEDDVGVGEAEAAALVGHAPDDETPGVGDRRGRWEAGRHRSRLGWLRRARGGGADPGRR